MTDRPLFLVADRDGITAAGTTDRVEHLDDQQLVALAGGVEAAASPAPAAGVAHVVTRPVPMVHAVTDDTVAAWSPASGTRVAVTSAELLALAHLGDGVDAMSPTGAALGRLVALGVLDRGPVSTGPTDDEGYLRVIGEAGDEVAAADVRAGAVGVHMVCASHIAGVPLGLGMLAASIIDHDGGRLLDASTCVRSVGRRRPPSPRSTPARAPGLFLFSNYLWSAPENLKLSARVKELAPGSVTVHGGPSAKYPGDVDAFLAEHGHVDIMVLGEGERTVVELLDRLDAGLDVDAVAGVPARSCGGATARSSGIRAGERYAELGELPSPYLMGLFDHLDGGLLDLMPLKTNRGCPYGCTFCDWGSAAMSRIRSFPMEHVVAELELDHPRGGTLFITGTRTSASCRVT